MVGNNNLSRVDTLELRELMCRKIGHERTDKYFDLLNRYLNSKLGKSEFAKSCMRTIGKENISLHNRLLQAMLKNACVAKIPPPKAREVNSVGVRAPHGYNKNSLPSLGDSIPQSPRKCRSPLFRDRKHRDRPSPLGPLGKSPSLTCEETVTRIQEQQSATELPSLSSRPPGVEDGEEVEQFSGSPSIPRWSNITPPLGVSVKIGGGCEALLSRFTNGNFAETCQSTHELPETRSLMSRLENKLASEGIGMSLDCANVLNNSLDVFLKRLIAPCVAMAGSRHKDPSLLSRQPNNQMIPGFNGIVPGRFARQSIQPTYASMLDFRVAMESNPSVLGKDWPSQFEKICHYASEE